MFHYDTNITTTYHDDHILFLETDQLKEEEKELIRNVVYQHELLEIFNIDTEEWNTKIIEKLYEKLCSSDIFCLIMKKVSTQLFGKEDPIIGLYILYSYQYMYLMHSCVSDYLKNASISESNLEKLQFQIDNLSV
jgi:hypothetical protein